MGDARSAAFYVIRFPTPGDAATATVETVATAAPVIDLVWQTGTLADGAAFSRIFVAPVALQRVDVYDAATGTWVDVNPADAEVPASTSARRCRASPRAWARWPCTPPSGTCG